MKSNKTFMLLSALGIVFVVDAHCHTSLLVGTAYFDYNSFFMPMFIFISGYFFREKNLEHIPQTILKKVKKLLVPYAIWSVLYSILEYVLRMLGFILYDADVTWKDMIVRPFTVGYINQLTAPAWFIITLFFIQIIYILFHKITNRIWNDLAAFVIFVCIGVGCVYASKHGYATSRYLLLLKVGFLLQFYQMGVVYHKYVEDKFMKWSKLAIMLTAILINILLLCIYGNGIVFVDIAEMSGFVPGVPSIMPLITSITGIAFWLCIVRIIEPALGNSKIMNDISNHTYEIMIHHYLFINLLNGLIWELGIVVRDVPFDIDAMRMSAFCHYEPIYQFRFLYLLFAVSGSLLLAKCSDRILRQIKTAFGKMSSAVQKNRK